MKLLKINGTFNKEYEDWHVSPIIILITLYLAIFLKKARRGITQVLFLVLRHLIDELMFKYVSYQGPSVFLMWLYLESCRNATFSIFYW